MAPDKNGDYCAVRMTKMKCGRGTPSVQTLVDMASVMFQELEEVPMTMVGGLDVHRQQITFDYVDDDGLVRWGQIRPATRKTLRGWLAEHCPDGDGEFALEGCTGWRYVSEKLAAAGGVCIWGIRPRLTSSRDTPEFCQSRQACLVNLRCISTAAVAPAVRPAACKYECSFVRAGSTDRDTTDEIGAAVRSEQGMTPRQKG
jgi:hypothetical protein